MLAIILFIKSIAKKYRATIAAFSANPGSESIGECECECECMCSSFSLDPQIPKPMSKHTLHGMRSNPGCSGRKMVCSADSDEDKLI